jgi:hypothetical protein
MKDLTALETLPRKHQNTKRRDLIAKFRKFAKGILDREMGD